jgi:hypothetical protein
VTNDIVEALVLGDSAACVSQYLIEAIVLDTTPTSTGNGAGPVTHTSGYAV